MSGEVYNLAILLSLKDLASGELNRFSANAHRANSQVQKQLQQLEKESRQQTQAIAKNIGKKTGDIDKLSVKLSDIGNLKNKGLESASKQSSAILKQINLEANALEDLSKSYQKSGKTQAAKDAEALAKGLREESKQLESVGTKVKEIAKLRKQGTDSAKAQANVLEQEVKDEVQQLDRLTSKFREVKNLRSSNLDVNIKADNLREQIKMMDVYEDRYNALREKMTRDAAIGGAGVAGLMILNKGIQSAATKEEAILQLKQAYEEDAKASGRSREVQERDIRRIMALATDLGNLLQGNTNQYAEIFTAMNKAGIDAETTLDGAGRAAAYLVNVNGALRKGMAPQVAEDLGSYGKMFDIRGKDYMRVVELFSALEDRFNIGSGSLVEASKYFFSTAKTAMDLRGIEGAETTAKLFAFMKRYAGREGSEAGTSLDAVLSQFIRHDEARKALKKDFGVDIQLFDDKGQFRGVENMFAQFEKLRKLSPESRAQRLHAIFGEQGARVVGAMVDKGVEGWRTITNEANKSVSVNEKINAQMQTYNAKVEALSGSWENFKSSAFTPLMDDAKKFVDTGSDIVNWLQKISAENPGLMGTLGTLALYGSTAMVVYGAFSTLTTGVRLFRMASAFSRGGGLIPYLNQTTVAANTTANALSATTNRVAGFTSNLNVASTSMATATKHATGLRGKLQGLAASPNVRLGIQIVGIAAAEYAVTSVVQSLTELSERLERIKVKGKEIRENYDSMMGQWLLYNAPGDYGGRKEVFQSQASKVLEIMKSEGTLAKVLNPERAAWYEKLYLLGKNEPPFHPDRVAEVWKQNGIATPLQDTNTLAQLLVQIRKGGGDDLNLNLGQIRLLEFTLQKIAGKDKMQIASELARKEMFGDQLANQNANFAPRPNQTNTLLIPTFSQSNFNNPLLGTSFQTGKLFDLSKPFGVSPFVNTNPQQQPQRFQTSFDTKPPVNWMEAFKTDSAATQQSFSELNSHSKTLSGSFSELSQQANQQKQNAEMLNQQGQTIQNFNQSLVNLTEPLTNTYKNFGNVNDSTAKVPSVFNRVMISANGASSSLDSLSSKISNWQMPIPQVQTYQVNVPNGAATNPSGVLPNAAGGNILGIPFIKPPGKADGGRVISKGLAYIHAGEDIVPANVTKQYQQPAGLTKFTSLMSLARESELQRNKKNIDAQNLLSANSSQNVTIHYAPTLTVNDDDKNSKAEFQAMLQDHTRQIERMVTRVLEIRRLRA